MSFEEIVRAHYFHEVERRRDLNAALSIPLAVLTALLAAIAAMVGSLSVPFDPVEKVMFAPGVVAAVAAGISIYHALRSYIGYTYRHPTSMGVLKDWRDEALSKGIARFRVEEDIRGIMTEQYAASAERNSNNNDIKSGYMHNAGIWLSISLVMVVAAGIPYTYLRMTSARSADHEAAGAATRIEQSNGAIREPRRPPESSSSSATSSPTPSANARHSGERSSTEAQLNRHR